MELPSSGGRMASQQERHWPQRQLAQHREEAEMQPLLRNPHHPNRPPSPVERMMMLCSGAQSGTTSTSSSSSSTTTSDGVGSKRQGNSKWTGRENTGKTNKSPSPSPIFARSNADTGAFIAQRQPQSRTGSSGRSSCSSSSSSSSGTRIALAPHTGGALSCSGNSDMQRHRKKDRVDRSAPPTIQKYLQFAGGAAGGGGATNAPTGLVAASENLYQPCGGLNLAHALGGELIGLKKGAPMSGASPLDEPAAGGTGTAAKGCCRKGGGVDLRTSYPEDNPDSIEVYRDKQQQHQGIAHPASLRIDMPDQCGGGGPCHQLQYPSSWTCGGAGEGSFASFPSGESGEQHTHHQQQQQQQQQQQHRLHRLGSDGTTSCASDPATSGSSGVGSAEYSYAYCEPILLQRPLAPDGPPATAGLAPSSSAYCVPVYHHHHPPALPLPQPHQHQHQQQHRLIRGGFPSATGGRTVATPYGARTLHHHHHHHHHNYTLPNSGTSTMATATTATPMATTTTGSLRALFTSFFRKSASASSSSSSSSSSAASSASGAVLNAAFSATPPFHDGAGGVGGDAVATLHHHHRPHGPLPPPERHSFTTCYGTKENIYEDIGSQSALQPSPGGAEAPTAALATTTPTMTTTSTAAAAASSIAPAPALPGSTSVATMPPSPPPLPPTAASPTGAPSSAVGPFHSVAAEWRRVQVQHERIIGELNLSVERLIMPSYDDEHCCPDQQHQQAQELSFRAPPAPPPGAAAALSGGASAASGGAAVGALPGSSAVSQPAGNTKRLHFTSSPSTTLAVVERHSPTISYGKSYGDVDSGISSSSTSGTSYSSSILYRSITNYQQQEGGGGSMSSTGGQQQQQQVRKVPMFGLMRAPMAGAALTLPGARASGSCGRTGHFLHASPSGGGGPPVAPGVSGMNVTNAPDPPPPPDTIASCCFFTEHRQHQQQPALPFPTGLDHWTGGGSGHFGEGGSRSERPTGGGGNFWTRFRRLHGRLTSSSSSGKQHQQQQQQQQRQQLHQSQLREDAFDDFSPAGPLWPMHQYAHHSHQYYPQHDHGPTHAQHHLHHLQQQQQQQQQHHHHHQPPLHRQPAVAGPSYDANASGTRDEGGDPPPISLHTRDFQRRYPTAPPAHSTSASTPVPPDSGSLAGLLVVTHEEEEEEPKEPQDNGSKQHQQEVQPQPHETQQQQTQESSRAVLNSPSSPSPSSSSSASSSSGSGSDSAASAGSSRSSPASVGSSDRTSAGSSPSPSPVAKLTTAG